jgi:hypothetical protein
VESFDRGTYIVPGTPQPVSGIASSFTLPYYNIHTTVTNPNSEAMTGQNGVACRDFQCMGRAQQLIY